MAENYLIISDAHIPFEHPLALRFLQNLKKDFYIKDENCYCVGDLLDHYGFSSHPKTPDAKYSADQEISIARDKIKAWAEVFPELKLCIGNHEERMIKRAMEADLPSQVIRTIEEVYQYPKGWQTKEDYTVFASKGEFHIFHGEGYSGAQGHINAAIDNGISVCIGHLHSFAGVNYIKTKRQDLWAMNVGSLLDNEAYAFAYGKRSRRKSNIGSGVVTNGGTLPFFIPLEAI